MLLASDWLGKALRKMEMEVQIQGKEGIVILEQELLPLYEEVRENNYASSDQPHFWEEVELQFLTSQLHVILDLKSSQSPGTWGTESPGKCEFRILQQLTVLGFRCSAFWITVAICAVSNDFNI